MDYKKKKTGVDNEALRFLVYSLLKKKKTIKEMKAQCTEHETN